MQNSSVTERIGPFMYMYVSGVSRAQLASATTAMNMT